MAIADEILVQPVEPVEAPVASKPRVLPRLAFGFLLGLVLVGGAAAAGLYAWDRSYEGRILPGVSAAGLDLTGLDRAQATAALDTAYDAVTTGQVVIQTEAGDVAVPYAQFGRHVDTAAMVDAALRAGRDGTTAERALGEIRLALDGQTIQPTLLFDPAALTARVDEALSRLDRRTRRRADREGHGRHLHGPGPDGPLVQRHRRRLGRADRRRQARRPR